MRGRDNGDVKSLDIACSSRFCAAVAVLLFLIAGAALDPQSRTQEARVLLGAREMIGQPIERWLIPTANGETRLNKPPLAYWMVAGVQSVIGTSVLSGRMVAVGASWLTVIFTYLIGSRLFDTRVGWMSAGTLAGSWALFRFGILAETDILVLAMITISVYAMLRAGESGSIGWLYLIGALIAGLILVKGPPAAYVVILMGLLDAIDGRWTRSTWRQTLTVRFVTSGAAVLMLLLAIPWFVYMRGNPEHGELANDFKNSIAGGKGHAEAWWVYFPQILVSIVPWVFVWIVAAAGSLMLLVVPWIVNMWGNSENGELKHDPENNVGGEGPAAARWLKVVMRWTRGLDDDRRGLLIAYAWGSVVLVPLLFWGNKQPHYLLPMLPALMLATGWAIDRGLSGAYQSMQAPIRAILQVMLATGVVAAIAMPAIGGWARSGVTMIDIASGASLLIFTIGLIVWVKRQNNPLAIAHAGMAGVLATMLVVKGVWAPTLEPASAATIAHELQTRYPNATFVFRDEPSMSLVVALGQSVRLMNDETLIQMAHDPDMVLVCLDESPVAPTLSHYRQDLRIETGEDDLYVLLPTQ